MLTRSKLFVADAIHKEQSRLGHDRKVAHLLNPYAAATIQPPPKTLLGVSAS